MSDEVHIASLVIQCQPDRLAAVCDQVSAESGAEIHASDPAGKLVVVLECDGEGAITEATDRFGRLDGVLSCNLVFHGIETEEALSEPATFPQESPA